MRRTLVMLAAVAAVALWAGVAAAGEYHSGGTLVCMDCHTMHYSQQHDFQGNAMSPGGPPKPGGAWLGTGGPFNFLLRAAPNTLCLACHDGQSFAPDVLAANINASPSQGRQAGALNDDLVGAPYDTWKGHTLDSTANPPGFDPAAVGLSPTWLNAPGGLECTSCHAQHGPATSYRNLGAYSMGGTASNFRPTYVKGAANDPTKDVWVTDVGPGTIGSRTAAEFNPLYDRANIFFNRTDGVIGASSRQTSNKLGSFCAACHANFHGGAGDAPIGATPAALDGFLRHPTAAVTIGAAGGQGYGGHSNLARFNTGNTTKVKVWDSTGGPAGAYTNPSPGCITCHKAHGNQNPFGLIFLARNAASVTDEGGYGAAQTPSLNQGMRNLCGQCHGQGSDGALP